MALLLKVLRDLEAFLPYLVLVGGWVPLLYSRYLWGIKQEPLTTIDIDFGFKDVPYKGNWTVADQVVKMNYGEHHFAIGRAIPFVPIVKIEKKDLKADVEFITGPETSSGIKERLIGREILINTIQDFDILFENTMMLDVEGFPITVPNPAIFVFHKLLTFDQRTALDKKSKDLFYVYYFLFFSPDHEKLSHMVRDLIQKHPAGRRVKVNIEKYFEDRDAKGPTMIAKGAFGSAIPGLISDILDDAYQRITALIAQ